jgi:hypothetical protein
MKPRLIAIYAFNLIDIIATLITTHNGFEEANPAMALLLQSPVLFAVVKFVVASLVICWLWFRRQYKLANIATWIVFIMYGVLSLYYAVIFVMWI